MQSARISASYCMRETCAGFSPRLSGRLRLARLGRPWLAAQVACCPASAEPLQAPCLELSKRKPLTPLTYPWLHLNRSGRHKDHW
jgi:hypothetical protein